MSLILVPYVSFAQSDSIPESVLCSCVRGARWLGVDIPLVEATYFQSFKPQTPTLNGLVLMSYKNGVNHVAVIKDFREDGLLVQETNYKSCQFTERLIDFRDRAIRGFWAPV